jgi:N-acetylglutamate synthase-like GNAT family acetyltransferase
MLRFITPNESVFLRIKQHIHEFELDDRNLQQHEFIAAFREEELLGFGRLRQYSDCIELSSLGVITKHRKKGIGKKIVETLIKQTKQPIHLVCVIPKFFNPFGFEIINKFPTAIQDKLEYCRQTLSVPETYVVMFLKK